MPWDDRFLFSTEYYFDNSKRSIPLELLIHITWFIIYISYVCFFYCPQVKYEHKSKTKWIRFTTNKISWEKYISDRGLVKLLIVFILDDIFNEKNRRNFCTRGRILLYFDPAVVYRIDCYCQI